MNNLSDFLLALSEGERLTEDQAYALMDAIMQGRATPAQIGGILMALRVRGETPDELTGFARAMRQHATIVPVHRRPLMDTCGTGGDRSHTFNVSTVAALVVAAAGVPVAKHGNRSATSKSGSADLLEALGIAITQDPVEVGRLVDEVGFGFLFAQSVHTSMRHAAPARRELGVRTVFNVLGPLTNPARPERQLVGVFAPEWLAPVAEVLGRLGVDRAMAVHGHGALDEVSLSGPTAYGLVEGGTVTLGSVSPDDLGLPTYPAGSFVGGDPQTNAVICRRVLANEPGPYRDMVLANAGMALFVARAADSPRDGVRLAQDALASGRALGILESLLARSRSLGQEA